jgi:hypothetical protein
MSYNLNKASSKQQKTFDPFPRGVYRLKARLRAGGFGPDGLLRMAKNGRTLMVDFEHHVVGGEFDGRKVWDLVTTEYDRTECIDLAPLSSEQASKYDFACELGLARIRAMIESANAIDPTDESTEAQGLRDLDGLEALDGIEFYALVDIKQQDGYGPQNRIERIITVDADDWPGTEKPSIDDDLPY